MFLTLEDPRAQIKGSRDPLGAQALWAAFGRHVVRNLTTVTTSVRNFTVLLLGRYLAQQLVESERAGEEEALDIFLRWEQVAGYVRQDAFAVGGEIRGIERVQRNLAEHGRNVPIGLEPGELILSDQRTYGLWGLYTVAARVSGLLPDGPLGVTPACREALDEIYLPRLGRGLAPLLKLVRAGGKLRLGKGEPLYDGVAAMLVPELKPREVEFYGSWLRDGTGVQGAPPGRQQTLARLLATTLDLAEPIGRASVLALAKAARAEDEALAVWLERIAALEAILAPAEALFDHVIARSGQRLEDLGRKIGSHWGKIVPNLDEASFADLTPELAKVAGPDLFPLIEREHAALAGGDYAAAIRHLLDWNALVMRVRGGGPWAVLEHGKIDVRYLGPEWLLPEREELPALWRNTYFLESLRQITAQLATGGRAE